MRCAEDARRGRESPHPGGVAEDALDPVRAAGGRQPPWPQAKHAPVPDEETRDRATAGERCSRPFDVGWNRGCMTTSPIRVLCIDDHALVREGLAALINRQADMHV